MGEVIVITSGKGGVGKTTTTANLGSALALAGKSVVMMDADIGLRNLDVALGLQNHVVYDLVDVIEGKCRIRQALVQDKRYDKLYLLAASQTRDKNAVTPQQMQALCTELKEQFDYVLIDCPAGIERGFLNAVAGADCAIVVTIAEYAAIRDADRIIGSLEEAGIAEKKLLINRMRSDLVKKGGMLSISKVVEMLAIPLIGVVPDDEHVLLAAAAGNVAAADKKSVAGVAFGNTALRLMGQSVPLVGLLEKKQGILRRIFAGKRN